MACPTVDSTFDGFQYSAAGIGALPKAADRVGWRHYVSGGKVSFDVGENMLARFVVPGTSKLRTEATYLPVIGRPMLQTDFVAVIDTASVSEMMLARTRQAPETVVDKLGWSHSDTPLPLLCSVHSAVVIVVAIVRSVAGSWKTVLASVVSTDLAKEGEVFARNGCFEVM